ncbi:MAG: 23S rRNA (pseudouridine(1915)-N(3))-methyltransferase RlmH [Candidatus Aminicenantes bacterium]|nr:MAG: 23S rRNA (pseudouridine(1915)-N(3))-methyltransferase RlmH [Candidatus Aminicenantes bacterium]
MKKIELICVGDLKFKALKELEQKYLQKINFFIPFNIRIIKDIKSHDDALKLKKEGQMILELPDKKDFVIALHQTGKKMDSIEFSRFLSDKISWCPGGIIFLIGGHAGLAKSLDSRIDFKLSFSDMTFAHDIFRILFLEQLYRSFTIMKGIKYHR